MSSCSRTTSTQTTSTHSGSAFLASVPVTLSTAALPPDCLESPHSHPGSSTSGPVTITAVPAQHGPVGCEPVSGEVIGFVFESAGWPTV